MSQKNNIEKNPILRICETDPWLLITKSAVLKQFVYFAIYINIKTQTLVNHSIYKMSLLRQLNAESIVP